MRDLIERIEEFLHIQERLVNLLLLSQSHQFKISVNTAFDMLYHNLELLELIEELLSMPESFYEEQYRDYSASLALEALTWTGILLPALEDVCPVFFHGVGSKERELTHRIRVLRKSIEEAFHEGPHHRLDDALEELHDVSETLRYLIHLARKAYTNLV